ncbi:MAG: hypothetical protein ABI876_12205, partial [Bacteroidota bacterium]
MRAAFGLKRCGLDADGKNRIDHFDKIVPDPAAERSQILKILTDTPDTPTNPILEHGQLLKLIQFIGSGFTIRPTEIKKCARGGCGVGQNSLLYLDINQTPPSTLIQFPGGNAAIIRTKKTDNVWFPALNLVKTKTGKPRARSLKIRNAGAKIDAGKFRVARTTDHPPTAVESGYRYS